MESVTRGAAWAYANARTTNLSTILEEIWARGHQPVLQEKCSTLGDLGGAGLAKCLTGVCLFTGDIAKQAVFLGGRLLANMKATFAPSSGSRTLLLEGRIVLELIREPMVENRSFDELVDLQDVYDTLILHVGLQYLKPFRPTFSVVVPGEAGPEIPASAGRMYVQVKNARFKGHDRVSNSGS